MTHMPTYRQITQPLTRETNPDVATPTDIDWRKVTVAQAIDADRQRVLDARAVLDRIKTERKRGLWATFCQVFGARS